jgi:signal transduction histidine kinase
MHAEPKVNILLVDDSRNNLVALKAMLEDMDLNLVTAQSGVEALRRLLAEDFALILLDVQMPGMDGFETAEVIRGRDRSRHAPIIFLTAFEHSEVQMFKGYSLGAVDFLSKPVVPQVLRSKIAVFVELHRKTEKVKQQAEQLRENQRREYARALAEQRRGWEMERLREEAMKEKRIAEELAEVDRRKDEFLAMLAHELRNPLAPLLNALHLLRLPDVEAAEVEQARDVADRQVRHLARLVDDLLDVSRIRSGKVQLRKQAVDLADAVARAIDISRPLIQARGHDLQVSLPSEPLILEADAARVEQILSNLLNNAAKYTESAGRITLLAERDGDTAVVRVRDTGIGIAPDLLPRIFDLFTQEERSLDRSQGGLGIGLTLVRSLVEMHGGKVSVSSDGPGRGSEFDIQLPLIPAHRAAQQQPGDPGQEDGPAGDSRPKRVLVVDDNLDGARMLARLVKSWGHDVSTAYDGPAALEMASAQHPDVVLLDIGLPGMDGYEVAQRLRTQPGLDQATLVALTGYGQVDDRRRSSEVGIQHHLVKPVDPETLERLLKQCEPLVRQGSEGSQ